VTTDETDRELIKEHCAVRNRQITVLKNMQPRQYWVRYTKNGKHYAAVLGVSYDFKLRSDFVTVLRGGLCKEPK
jgi:hypothetical protein